MERTCLRDDNIRVMLFQDKDENGESDESYILSDGDGEVDMMLSDSEND